MTRLKFIAKEREELIEPAMAVVNFLKVENKFTWMTNKKQQLTMFVDLNLSSNTYVLLFESLFKLFLGLKLIKK